MPERDEIIEGLRAIVVDVLEIDRVDLGNFRGDRDLVRDLGASSLARIEIVVRVEKDHRIQFSDEALNGLRTFDDLVAKTMDALADAAPAADP